MTTEQLQKAGRLLYGDQWQSALARALDVDSRRIRQWMSGDRPISDWVEGEIMQILKDNHAAIGRAIDTQCANV